MSEPSNTPVYFAASEDDEIGPKLHAKTQAYKDHALVSSLQARLNNAYLYYYGYDLNGNHATSGVQREGEQGELAAVRVNHSRSLVNTLLNIIIAPKLVWQPKAINIDYRTLIETDLAASLLEFYWTDKHVSSYAAKATEEAIFLGEGFVFPEWDEEGGEEAMLEPAEPAIPDLDPVTPQVPFQPGQLNSPMGLFGDEAGPTPPVLSAPADPLNEMLSGSKVIRTGDIKFTNISTWDVIRDPQKKSWDELDWVTIRVPRNKFDLAKKYPDKAKEIHEASSDDSTDMRNTSKAAWESDDISCYYFFHKRRGAMPEGKEVVYIDNGRTVLHIDDLSYDEIPLYRVTPAELIGTPYGYSPYFEVLGIQEVMDSLHSTVTTNQTTFGVQNIVLEQGSEIEIDDLAGGMRAIYVKAGTTMKPEALQLTKTPPEIFNYLETLRRDQELLFGLNSVVRGQTQNKEEMSGVAMALLQSQVLQQASGLVANYLKLVSGLGMAVCQILKRKASIPFKAAIAGGASEALMQEVTVNGDSLGRINKVQVEVGNPMSQTAAGRAEIANQLLQMGLIKTPEQYLQVLTSGQIKPLTKTLQNELLLVASENEDIRKGVAPPRVMIHDDHLLHCREHRSEVASPSARRNVALLKAGIDHIHEHYKNYYGVTDPLMDPLYRERMLELMGVQQPQIMPMVPPPGAVPPGAPAGGPPAPLDAAAPGDQPKITKFPKNPTTGQEWNPTDAGGAVPR